MAFVLAGHGAVAVFATLWPRLAEVGLRAIRSRWSNQRVFAIGAAIDLSPTITLRAGYNYGRSPVPLNNLNPLLAAIGERHFTAGLAHKLAPGWSIGYGIEYQQSANPKYTNAALPFGSNAQERSNFPALHFMSSHRW